VTRGTRIALELLGPPFVASVIIAAIFAVLDRDPTAFVGLPFILVFAYVWAGLPAAAFTLVLEVTWAKGVDPGSWRAVRVAALAGLPSGLLVTLWFAPWAHPGPLPGFAIFGALGAATGGITGLLVRARTRSRREW
jgi:hypothetical protein